MNEFLSVYQFTLDRVSRPLAFGSNANTNDPAQQKLETL